MAAEPPKACSSFTPSLTSFVESRSDNLANDQNSASFPLYQEHFPRTRKAVCGAFAGVKNTALIVGVGKGRDIPLEALAQTFTKVFLVDVDLRYVKNALEEQVSDPSLREKFELEEGDLSGILLDLSEKVGVIADQDLSYEQFVSQVLDLLANLKKREFPYQKRNYSFLCSSLVGSQLSGTVVGYLDSLSLKKYQKRFRPPEDRSLEWNAFMVGLQVNHLFELRTLASPGGRVYFADHFSMRSKALLESTEETVVADLGGGEFPGVKSITEAAAKYFKVVSRNEWEWGIPTKKNLQRGAAIAIQPDGSKRTVDVVITEFDAYQISSFVFERDS